MITKFHVKPLRFFPGYSAGLIDKTALVELSWEGDIRLHENNQATLALPYERAEVLNQALKFALRLNFILN